MDVGTDCSTYPRLDPSFALISGPRVVLESVARRWSTSLGGGLFYDPTYGFGTPLLLNAALTQQMLPGIAAQLESQALQDERVKACDVTLTFVSQTGALTIAGAVTLADGPFSLVMTVDAATGKQTLIFGV